MTKRHVLALAPLLALLPAGCSSGPPRVVEARPSQEPAARGSALLRDAMLTGHNRARAIVGVPPLAWDDTLAAHARAYAEEMARTGRFQHAEQPQGPGREGENLFTGTRGAYSYAEMVQLWVDEQKSFVNEVTPNFSRTGNWRDVGHYTQIVWRTSRAVGCALAGGPRDDYLVCRYSPPGNVVGQRAF
ncbi:CAP domain-containing protein [Sphingomonas aracearum]|nr:CAP domain-containing protein [Sphingomonas aracearum]